MNEEIERTRQEVAKLSAVKDLVQMPGWKIVHDHFTDVMKAITEALAVEEDFKKIKRFQERLRAFRSMLETVETLCEQHSVDLLRLEEMEIDNNERVQYGLNTEDTQGE